MTGFRDPRPFPFLNCDRTLWGRHLFELLSFPPSLQLLLYLVEVSISKVHFEHAWAVCPAVSFSRSESVRGLKLQDKRSSNRWLWNCIRAFFVSGSVTVHTTRCVPLRSGLQLSSHGSPVSVQWTMKETQEEQACKETFFLWLHCLLVSPTLHSPNRHKIVSIRRFQLLDAGSFSILLYQLQE